MRPRAAAVEAIDTRTRLLRAAGHLFARKGIDAVRNHEIHELAGQRNESAIHYHFGNRWNIVVAILEENELAAAPLIEAANPGLKTPEAVVAFLVDRLAIGLGSPEGRDWLRIVAELMSRFSDDRSQASVGRSDQLLSVADRLCEQMTDLPKRVVRRRAVALVRFMTVQMADRARDIDDGVSVSSEREFLEELVSMSLGLLSAPRRTVRRSS